MKTAIIGAGEMGAWFAEKYRDLDREVSISDINQEKSRQIAENLGIKYGSNEEIIREANEVVLAASLDSIEGIIADNCSHLSGKIVYDIASVKNGIVKKLRDVGKNTFSIHPMWGGATSGFSGQNLILIPTHSLDDSNYSAFLSDYGNFFRQQGANVRQVRDENEHDKLMAETLAIYHFGLMVMGKTISGNGLSLNGHKEIIGTTATLADVSIESVVHSNPKLYAEIQMRNPHFPEAMERFTRNAIELSAIVNSGDRQGFEEFMGHSSNYFRNGKERKPYLNHAKAQFMAAVDGARRIK